LYTHHYFSAYAKLNIFIATKQKMASYFQEFASTKGRAIRSGVEWERREKIRYFAVKSKRSIDVVPFK